MPALTQLLQEAFDRWCPAGWSCRREVPVLSPERCRLLGFSPRVDVLLEKNDATRRLWIEFEVSRADPVANHAKFATSHLFEPQPANDAFVAMVSSHVTLGRHNLSACMIEVMRRLGMNAFHTVLLPSLPGSEIKRLNHTGLDTLRREDIDLEAEVERALVVSEPVGRISGQEVYFAGNLFEVSDNVRQWNRDMTEEANQQLWGQRTVMYFVFDPVTATFAPSKFCAYQPVARNGEGPTRRRDRCGMSVPYYAEVDQNARLFDGARARQHLGRRLGMMLISVDADRHILGHFQEWIRRQHHSIRVHPTGAHIIVPPAWARRDKGRRNSRTIPPGWNGTATIDKP